MQKILDYVVGWLCGVSRNGAKIVASVISFYLLFSP